jgi:alpha-1,2-mannosyltransferase
MRPARGTATWGLSALAVLFLGLAWYSSTKPVDFQIYHRVAGQVINGDYELYPRVGQGTDRGDSHEFQYAPILALIFVPLGLLPLQAAAFLFAVLKIPAYAYVGWVIARRLDGQSRYATLLWIALLVVGGYIVEEFRNGNVHAFVGLLMVVAFDQSEKGRIVTPAAALGVAIAAKLTPLALLAYFAWRRRFAVCGATLVAVAVLWAVPALVVGWDMNNHLTMEFVRATGGMADESDNYSLRGVLLRWLTRGPLAAWMILLLVLAVAMALVFRRPPRNQASKLLELSLVLTGMLVVSPHTQRIHFSTLFVPAVTLIALVVMSPQMRGAWLARSALVVNAAAATFLPLVFGGRTASLAYQAFEPYLAAAMVLLVVLMVLLKDVKSEAGLTPSPHLTSRV